MDKVLIADVSFYEDDPNTARHIDYAKMKAAGVEGVIVRAGQNTWVDPSFIQSWGDTKKAGLPRGSYWFYDSRVSPYVQAKAWYNLLQNVGDYGELPLFADYEESYKGAYAGSDYFKIFLEELKRLFPNKEIIIYTGYWYWKENSSITYYEYFKQFSLWIAAYNNVAPQIPAPWTDYVLWQYTDKGAGATYGTEGEVDLNWFNGSLADFKIRFNLFDKPIDPTIDEPPLETHEGVKLHKITRFGTQVWVHIIDTQKARIEISGCGYRTSSYAIDKYGCQIASNGGGWPNVQDANHRSNEMWVSNGISLQQPKYIFDNRPYINISKTGTIMVSPNATVLPDIYNAVGYDRLLVKFGKFNDLVKEVFIKDARTGSGVTADNKFVLVVCEGNDIYQRGLNLRELAEVLIEFGAIWGGNNDGGSSSTIINTALSPVPLFVGTDGHEPAVINHIMVFANVLGDVIEIPEEGNMNYEVIKSARFRSLPTCTTNDTGASSTVGEKFYSTVTQTDTHNSGITMVQHPNGKWLPVSIALVDYTRAIGNVEPVPTIITKTIDIDTTNGKIRIDGGAWQ